MKQLHELLRMYINRSGYTIYGLAKTANVKRSTLQKILLGNMKLSRENMLQILPYLRLSAVEQEEFEELQQLQEHGTEIYLRRELIRHFLIETSEGISECLQAGERNQKMRGLVGEQPALPGEKATANFGIVTDRIAIEEWMLWGFRRELEEIQAVVRTNVPASYAPFYRRLREALTETEHGLELMHMTAFDAMNANAFQDHLRVLAYAIPAAFLPNLRYSLYDAFGTGTEEEMMRHAFPYFISGSCWSILLSPDCKTACVSCDVALSQYLNNLADFQKAHAIPLMCVYEKAETILSDISAQREEGAHCCMLQQPCFVPLLDEELVATVIGDSGVDEACKVQLTALMMQRVRCLQEQDETFCTFTREGIRRFAADGRMDEVPELYVRAFSSDERRALLLRMYEAIQTERLGYRLINPQAFPLARCFGLLAEGKRLIMVGFRGSQADYRHVVIEDRMLAETFRDYFQVVQDSTACYSKEETLSEIMTCLQFCGQEKEKNGNLFH